MLSFLFPRLTNRPPRGQALFDQVVEEARRQHWYVEGGVPDTIDGRFAMLATVCALAIVRVERAEGGTAHSAALSERFIEAMDAEHRQMGINDPALGRKVRKLLGALGRRVEEWREAIDSGSGWDGAVRSSLYPAGDPADAETGHSAEELRALWERLARSSDEDVLGGRF